MARDFNEKNAAKGAAVGTFFGPLGTVAGGVLGGYFSDEIAELDPTRTAKVADFNAPELERYQDTLDPYAGALNGQAGGGALTAAERAAGVKSLDPGAYRDSLLEGLRARTDQGIRTSVNDTVNAGSSRGLGSSELTQALEFQGRMAGESAFAQGAADIDQDLMDKVLAENAQRRQLATGLTQADLDNQQFGANYALSEAQLAEGGRQFDQDALYGGALDTYIQNEVNPAQRRDDMKAGVIQAGAGVLSGGLSAAGSVAGAGMAKGKK